MSYSSIEEVWGSDFKPTMLQEPNNSCHAPHSEALGLIENFAPSFTSNNDTNGSNKKTYETPRDFQETQSSSTVAPPKSDQFSGSITDPPLRGSLLYGTEGLPQRQDSKHKTKEGQGQLFEFKNNTLIGEKLDKMIELLSKKTCTSWTDVLIFVAIGILVIVALDIFFKFGKWMILKKPTSATLPQQHFAQMYTPAPAPTVQYSQYAPPSMPTMPSMYRPA